MLIATACWPSDKTDEIIKKAIEVVQKFPPDPSLGENIVSNAVKSTTDGIKAISISEVKEGKLEEAITRSTNQLVMYQSIAGYEWSLDVWYTLVEAYAALGKTPPE